MKQEQIQRGNSTLSNRLFRQNPIGITKDTANSKKYFSTTKNTPCTLDLVGIEQTKNLRKPLILIYEHLVLDLYFVRASSYVRPRPRIQYLDPPCTKTRVFVLSCTPCAFFRSRMRLNATSAACSSLSMAPPGETAPNARCKR